MTLAPGRPRRLALTGGGTGGHVYPALAIAEALATEFPEVLFVGTRRGLESRIVPAAGVAMATVHAAPLLRSVSPALVRTLFSNALGYLEALRVLARFRPDLLVATGGYVALPVVAAMRTLRALGRSHARIAVLEPNAVSGLANRLVAPLADDVWYGASPGRELGPNEAVVGIPVRAALRHPMASAEARAALGLDPARATVVAIGGSQGARSINGAIAGWAEAGLPAGLQIAVIAGTRDAAGLRARLAGRERVVVLDYLADPRAAYAAADLVVARAGASTLGELAATGVPALLVPYPHATADHQTRNAAVYAAGGAARTLADAALDAASLAAAVAAMLEPGALAALRSAAREGASRDPRVAIAARVKTLLAANDRRS